MTKRRGVAVVALLVCLALLIVVAACDKGEQRALGKERYDWVIAKKLTVEQGGATFNGAVAFNGDVSLGSSDVDLDGNDLIIDTDGDSILDENTDDAIRMTIGAATGTFSVLTGNMKVGNGTPTTSQDGEDAYVEGGFEVDGTARFDGAVGLNQTNAAGASANPFDITSSLGIMDGSDDYTAIDINITNANHTTATNTIYGMNVSTITQDAEATEIALYIGNGWDVGLDLDGNKLDLDNDQDTSIRSSADDIITVEVSGADDFALSANSLTLLAGSKLHPENATNEGVVFAISHAATYNVTSTQTVAVVPANANVVDWYLLVSTAFNGSGTDTLNCGTSGDADKFVDDLDASAAGRNEAGDAADTQQDEWTTSFGDVGGSDVTVQCQYTDQNGDASAGAATFVLLYRID